MNRAVLRVLLPAVLFAPFFALGGCTTTGGYRGTVEFGRTIVLGTVARNPELVSVEPPVYPRELLQQGTEGTAVVAFTVSEVGDIRNVRIIEASRAEFGAAAVAAAKRLRYRPARQGVRSVPCDIEITFIFRLE